jgi:hypothetical protein
MVWCVIKHRDTLHLRDVNASFGILFSRHKLYFLEEEF